MTKFLAVIAVLLAVLLLLGHIDLPGIPLPRIDLGSRDVVRQTIQLLKSDYVRFLVTRRLTTQVILERDQGSRLFGGNLRLLATVVRIYWGVNLDRITENDVSATLDGISVTLPDPEILDCVVDIGTARAWRVWSGLNWALTQFRGDGAGEILEVLGLAQDQALAFFRENGLLPGRDALVADLNGWAEVFRNRIGTKIVFR